MQSNLLESEHTGTETSNRTGVEPPPALGVHSETLSAPDATTPIMTQATPDETTSVSDMLPLATKVPPLRKESNLTLGQVSEIHHIPRIGVELKEDTQSAESMNAAVSGVSKLTMSEQVSGPSHRINPGVATAVPLSLVRPSAPEAFSMDLLSLMSSAVSNRDPFEWMIRNHPMFFRCLPHDHPSRHFYLAMTGSRLITQFQESGRIKDVHDAITYLVDALALPPSGPEGPIEDEDEMMVILAATVSILGDAYKLRFEALDRNEDLDEAIDSCAKALTFCPTDDPRRSSFMEDLAQVFQIRFERKGQLEDIDEAIDLLREALTLTTMGDDEEALRSLASSLNWLGDVLILRFGALSELVDLDEAITNYAKALAFCTSDDPKRLSFLHDLVQAHVSRFRKAGKTRDIDEVIGLLREALVLPSTRHGHGAINFRLSALDQLGDAFMLRFHQLSLIEDVDSAVETYTNALALCPETGPLRLAVLDNLLGALLARFRKADRIEDIDKAIDLQRQGLTLMSDEEEDTELEALASHVCNLGSSLFLRFGASARLVDLDEAIENFAKALVVCPNDDPNRLLLLNNLMRSYMTRFNRTGHKKDIDQAIERQREVLVLPLAEAEDRANSSPLFRINQLEDALALCFIRLGRGADLQQAMDSFHRAVHLYDKADSSYVHSLHSHAVSLLEQFGLQDRIEYLEDGVRCNSESLPVAPNSSSDSKNVTNGTRALSLNGLGLALITRFTQFSAESDLDEAISSFREAAILRPREGAIHLNLGAAWRDRFLRTGEIENLDQAIMCQYRVLALEPFLRCEGLNNLAGMLLSRYGATGHINDRYYAIRASRRPTMQPSCVISSPTVVGGHFERIDRDEGMSETLEPCGGANYLNSEVIDSFNVTDPGANLVRHSERGGRVEDLNEAIIQLHEALPLAVSGYNRAVTLLNLANAISKRFAACGGLDDLEETTVYYREALDLLRRDRESNEASELTAMTLNSFASLLMARFKLFDRTEDLEEAVELSHEVLALILPEHVLYPFILADLGSHLHTRFRRLGRLHDLNEAINHHRRSLSLYPPLHLSYSSQRQKLAITLLSRSRVLDQLSDLEEAILLLRQCLTTVSAEHPSHALHLHHLATCLSDRGERMHLDEDRKEALELRCQAVATLAPLDPKRSFFIKTLALMHADNGDFEQAVRLLREAADHPTSAPRDRLNCACTWALVSRNVGHPSALEAYIKSLELLNHCVMSTPTMNLQHRFLARNTMHPQDLVSNAATCAIEGGRLGVAVEMLEQGRALLWSRMRGYRHPLEKLQKMDQQLAEVFEETANHLAQLATASSSDIIGDHSIQFDDQVARNHQLTETFSKILVKIRALDGFATFLQASPFDSLRTAAREGPIILVNIDGYRSDALILSSTSSPRLVSLASDVPNIVIKLSLNMLNIDRSARAPDRYGVPSRPHNVDIGHTLGILWEKICEPIANELQAMELSVGSRIWWCPIGKLATLPLHAAGIYENGALVRGFPDLYISSYIPTLSSLITSREAAAPAASQVRLLGVGQSNVLSNVKGEFQKIQGIFSRDVQLRDCEDALPATVLADLKNCSWVHFACHGSLDVTSPFESGFILHDNKRLSLRQIMQAKLPNAELAFLAACHSAAAGPNAPDEVLSLAAAVQFCGFRSIVGTLWTMNDSDGPVLAEAFYKHMLRNGQENADVRDSAEAVHLATKAMRERGVPIQRWATFIHLGV